MVGMHLVKLNMILTEALKSQYKEKVLVSFLLIC